MTRYAYVDDIEGGVVLSIAESDDARTGNWVVCEDRDVSPAWGYTPPSTFTAPSISAADFGALLILRVNALERQNLSKGIIYGGQTYGSSVEDVAGMALDRHAAITGSKKSRGRLGGQTTETTAQRDARTLALITYRRAVEAKAYDLVASINTEIGNDDLSALQAIAASINSGWPTNDLDA